MRETVTNFDLAFVVCCNAMLDPSIVFVIGVTEFKIGLSYALVFYGPALSI